jgi:hypothetical protein
VSRDPLTKMPFHSQQDAAKYVARVLGTTVTDVRRDKVKVVAKVHAPTLCLPPRSICVAGGVSGSPLDTEAAVRLGASGGFEVQVRGVA